MVKNLPVKQEIWIWSLSGEDLLKKELATHSSILAWEILWTAATGLQSWVHKESDTTYWLNNNNDYKCFCGIFRSTVQTWNIYNFFLEACKFLNSYDFYVQHFLHLWNILETYFKWNYQFKPIFFLKILLRHIFPWIVIYLKVLLVPEKRWYRWISLSLWVLGMLFFLCSEAMSWFLS